MKSCAMCICCSFIVVIDAFFIISSDMRLISWQNSRVIALIIRAYCTWIKANVICAWGQWCFWLIRLLMLLVVVVVVVESTVKWITTHFFSQITFVWTFIVLVLWQAIGNKFSQIFAQMAQIVTFWRLTIRYVGRNFWHKWYIWICL